MYSESAILMATYNGEKFISDQIFSIQNQTRTNWRLYIRDDGSTDRTMSIIEKFVNEDPRIKLISDKDGNIGVKRGFMRLLRMTKAEYYFFSDQDDIWLPDKMDETIKKFETHSSKTPVLVHTNLTTVDEKLGILNRNFYPISNKIDNLNVMLASNSVTGCTMAVNNALREKIYNDPAELMIMHDWWMGLCAVTLGSIEYVQKPTILYRQHATNQVGTDTTLREKINRVFSYNTEVRRAKGSFKQAGSFLRIHGFEITMFTKKIISAYAKLLEEDWAKRVSILLKYSFKKQSFIGTVSLWYVVIRT